MFKLEVTISPVYLDWNNLDFRIVPFFPNDEARTEQYMEQAGVVGIATWLSFIFGVGMKLMLAFAMVGIFIIAYVF